MLAAFLQAAGAGNMLRHRAVHPHLAHRHAAKGSAVTTIHVRDGQHAAHHTGKSRLGSKHRDHHNSDDLKDSLHPLRKDYYTHSARSVP